MVDNTLRKENIQAKSIKNAFMLIAEGFRPTKAMKKTFNEVYEGWWSSIRGTWVFPIENHLAVMEYVKKNGIIAESKEIFDLDLKKPKVIRNMEAREQILRNEYHAELKSLMIDVDKYDKTLGVDYFEYEPAQEGKSEISHERELDFHRRFKALHKKKVGIDNLHQSVSLQEAEQLSEEDSVVAAVIEELNKKHAVVHTGQTYYLTEKPSEDGKGIDFTLETRQSLVNLYENQTVELEGGKKKSKAKIWLEHKERRQYNGITFNPKKGGHSDGLYNIWQGFSVVAKKGCCELFLAFLKDVICAGDEERFRYLKQWCSHLVQHPDRLLPALLLMSNQGTGKNTFVDTLGMLFGAHYLPLDSLQQLVGNFNFHQKNAVLMHGNESLWGGNKKDIGRLKTMITEEFCCIEGKGKDVVKTRNYRHLIVSSNEDWPVHLDRDDRRFVVFKVSEAHKEDIEYFQPIYDELGAGGYEALLDELQHEDISDFNPHKQPRNNEAFEIKLMSASSVERYIYDVLRAGCFNVGNASPETERWREAVTKEAVYVDYTCWSEGQRMRVENKEALGRALSKLIPSITSGRPTLEGTRQHCYELPTLKKAREEFQTAFKSGAGIWER